MITGITIKRSKKLTNLNLEQRYMEAESFSLYQKDIGYKAKTSTTQCTWLVTEVLQNMLRNGAQPVVTLLDCSKAFDKCKFAVLFNRLLEKNLPRINRGRASLRMLQCLPKTNTWKSYIIEVIFPCLCSAFLTRTELDFFLAIDLRKVLKI